MDVERNLRQKPVEKRVVVIRMCNFYLRNDKMEAWHILIIILLLVSLNYMSRIIEDKFRNAYANE